MRVAAILANAMRVLEINGKTCEVDAPDDTPLLWVLRDHLALNGTKFGCGVGLCGACTVHLDGAAVRSCMVRLSSLEGRRIATIEGLAAGAARPIVEAWIAEQVPQCGFCQPGMVMAVAALLRANPTPSDTEVEAAITNLCRCGTYGRIRRAIRRAARGGEPSAGGAGDASSG